MSVQIPSTVVKQWMQQQMLGLYQTKETFLTCDRDSSASKMRFAVKLVMPLLPSVATVELTFTGCRTIDTVYTQQWQTNHNSHTKLCDHHLLTRPIYCHNETASNYIWVWARSSHHVAGDGYAGTFVFLHLAAVQQITDRGLLSATFKEALVQPLLKKVWPDAGDQKSFRTVSNLPFLSELLERVVQAELQAFLESDLLLAAGGEANRILLACVLSSLHATCPNRVSRHNWIIAVSLGCFTGLHTSLFQTNWYHLMPSGLEAAYANTTGPVHRSYVRASLILPAVQTIQECW